MKGEKPSRVAATSRRTQSGHEARGQKLPCLVTVDHSLVAYSAVTVANDSPPTMGSRRPLPALPTTRAEYYYDLPRSPAMYSATNPYFNSQVPYSPFSDHGAPDLREEPTSSVPVGTMLHKGFYDLLAMIPTPSPSRLLWGPPAPPSEPIVAGPRYEQIPAGIPPEIKPVAPAISANVSPTGLRKGRRISKDMVSHPTGFMCVLQHSTNSITVYLFTYRHLVHASDADQAEALLTRWGPDGLGKLGGKLT